MLKKIFIGGLLAALLTGCGNKEAVKFNNQIVDLEKELEPVVMETESKVGQFVNARQFDSMQAVSARAEAFLGAKIAELEAMKVPNLKEAGTMKDEAVRYFKYMQSLYTSYKEVAAAGAAGAQEQMQAKADEMMAIMNRKDAVLTSMKAAQQKFASANNMKVK